jgi:hypothetical protein
VLLSGGGYLNASWRPEVANKIKRLALLRGEKRFVGHGLEIRGLADSSMAEGASRLLSSGRLAVRDVKSLQQATALKISGAEVMPDGIALLYSHLSSYVEFVPEMEGRVLLNLLDIPSRPDSKEAEIPVANWREYCHGLVSALGDRAVALVVGEGDRSFANSIPGLRTVEPRSVRALSSLIASAEGLVSVRMHPALISTMLRKPTVSIPYCGKVTPTLEALGVESVISRNLVIDETMERLSSQGRDFHREWAQASDVNQDWILRALSD